MSIMLDVLGKLGDNIVLTGSSAARKDPWQPKDFREFSCRYKCGRALHEVERDTDMPSRAYFLRYPLRDAKLKRQYDEIWESLPFAVQVRANKTGERCRRTLVRLRRSGKTFSLTMR